MCRTGNQETWLLIIGGCFVFLSAAQTQCSLNNGQCTYTVNLATTASCPPAPGLTDNYVDDRRSPEALRQHENDKINTLQKDLDTVKLDHNNRIKELEMSIQKVLRNSVSTGPVAYQREHVNIEPIQETRAMELDNETPEKPSNLLLFQLQNQFNRMTKTLSETTADLLEANNKLNETTELLTAAQRQAFNASNQLALYQTKSTFLERETNILKNRVKDKTERLEFAEERLNATESKLIQTETQLYDVVRAESTVREELETLKITLNKTQTELAGLKREHEELEVKFRKTKRTLALREEELMECYSGNLVLCIRTVLDIMFWLIMCTS